jgi:DNA-binding IclR family transcriptional regulator
MLRLVQNPSGQERGPGYPISSVDNALRLLLMFRDHDRVRVAEVSRHLGVVRSTAHRLLAMLAHHHLVRQDPDTRAYHAGPALWDIGLAVVRNIDIRQGLHAYMERLSDELGETIQLVLLNGAEARFVDAVESNRTVRVGTRVGTMYPAHATAAGKVLLAELTESRLHELYPTARLNPATPRLKTRKQLERELETIRAQGYATNFGENEPDVAAVAVLARNAFGTPRAALVLSAPYTRLAPDAVAGIARHLARVAAEAAEHLV